MKKFVKCFVNSKSSALRANFKRVLPYLFDFRCQKFFKVLYKVLSIMKKKFRKIEPPPLADFAPEAIRVLRKRGTFPPPSAKIVRNSPPFRSWKREIFYENACFSCPKSSKNAYFSKNRALCAHIIKKLQFLGPFWPSKRPIFDPFGRWGKFPRDPQFSPKSFSPPPFEISRNAFVSHTTPLGGWLQNPTLQRRCLCLRLRWPLCALHVSLLLTFFMSSIVNSFLLWANSLSAICP